MVQDTYYTQNVCGLCLDRSPLMNIEFGEGRDVEKLRCLALTMKNTILTLSMDFSMGYYMILTLKYLINESIYSAGIKEEGCIQYISWQCNTRVGLPVS